MYILHSRDNVDNVDCKSTVLQYENKIISIDPKCGVIQVEFLREHTHMHTHASHTENGWIDILSEMDQI